MKGTLLTQQKKTYTKTDDLHISQNPEIPYEYIDEHTVDCPDCFDTMIKIHEADKIRYYCENCDLIISEMEVLEYIV